MDGAAKGLFAKLRPYLLGLGTDVVELFGSKSITYRVYDFFLEIIPRKHRLSLLLNLDYEECDDPLKLTRNATEYAFIVNAKENGGVVFSLKDTTSIADAIKLIRQAYEKVSE
jgi:predicted transport protein